MGDNRAMEYMRGRRILEINPDSPVIASLRQRLETDPAGVAPMTELLYETALITGGFTVDSPKDFANRCACCDAQVTTLEKFVFVRQ
jgi:heat shock protein beta